MPFEEIEERAEATALHAECSIRLTRVKGGRIRTAVSTRKKLADQLQWAANTPVGLLVGTGDDAGKLLLVPNSKKPIANLFVRPKSSSYSLNFGYVVALGDVECTSAPAHARILDDGKVELTLPNFADYPVGDEDEREEEDDVASEDEPPPVRKASKDEPTKPQERLGDGRPPLFRPTETQRTTDPLPDDDDKVEVSAPGTVAREGVIISVNPPMVSHDGNQIPLLAFQQRVMVALLPSLVMGPTPGEHIAKKLGTTVVQVVATIQALQVILGRVDLSVEAVRGVGYKLLKI